MNLNLSQLRKDFKDVYKENWQTAKKLSVLVEATKLDIAPASKIPPAAKRLGLLRLLHDAGISPRTLQRWKRSYRNDAAEGLLPKDRGRPPKKEPSPKERNIIENYRKLYRWGSEVIEAHLLRDHGIRMNRYRIDRFLAESGSGKLYPCTTAKKVKAKRRRHTKKVAVPNPGEHTQMDVKYQLHLLGDRTKAYVYNFIDHASNWSYKRAYAAINVKNTSDFMERLLKECPFTIRRLQTDNGTEFTFKWASKHPDDPKEHPLFKICLREGIAHKLIPPGEKELQGLVERSHRQDDQELYSRISPFNLEEFNRLLADYCGWRNRGRRFKKLLWVSPDRWLALYFANREPTVSESLKIAS